MAIKFLSGLNLSNVTAGSILKLDSNGNIVAAVAGTDYISTSSASIWSTTQGGIYYSDNVRVGTYQTDLSPDANLHVFDYQTTTPKILIEDGNTGDASMEFKISTQSYTIGIDNSDSDKFVLSASGGLGTSNILEIASSGIAAFQNSVLVKGQFYVNSTEQVQQGSTFNILSLQNSGTEIGSFQLGDSGNGYFIATGFKTSTASTGFLKADGTVDTGDFFSGVYGDLTGTPTLGTMAAANTSDYKDSDTVESYVGQELSSYTPTSSFGTNAFTSFSDHSTQGYLTALPFHTHDDRYLRRDTFDVMQFDTSTGEMLKFQNSTSGGTIQIGFQQNDTDGLHHRAYFKAYKSAAGLAAGKFDIVIRSAGGGFTGDVFELEAGAKAKWQGNNLATESFASAEASAVQDNLDGLTSSLGTAAYTASTNYATAAQGALADSALQSLPSHNHDDRYYTETESDQRFPRGRTISYSSVDTASESDAWYKIFTTTDSDSAPVECHVRGYAHTSMSFIVSEGYLGSGGHVQVLDYCLSTNNSYKWIKGVRIISNGDVELLLNGGSTVGLEMTVIGDAIVFSQPRLSNAAANTVKDTVVNLTTGMLRAKGNITGANLSGTNTGDQDLSDTLL